MATPLVTDELWVVIESLLPPEPVKPKGGRLRVDNRAALTGILLVLESGIPWEMLPQEMGCDSGMTCWRRLMTGRQWVFGKSCTKHCWHACKPPNSSTGPVRAWIYPASRSSGAQTGPNPTDRGKAGAKRHESSERLGRHRWVVERTLSWLNRCRRAPIRYERRTTSTRLS
jgi:transposase